MRKEKGRVWFAEATWRKKVEEKNSDRKSNAARGSKLRTQWVRVLVKLEERLEMVTGHTDALWEVFCLKGGSAVWNASCRRPQNQGFDLFENRHHMVCCTDGNDPVLFLSSAFLWTSLAMW